MKHLIKHFQYFDQIGIDMLKSFIFNLKIHSRLMLWVNIHYKRTEQFCTFKKHDSGSQYKFKYNFE